jgi:hypothetical protein
MVGAQVGWFGATPPFGRLSATPEQIIVNAGLDDALLKRQQVQSVYRGRFFVRNVIAFQTNDHSADWVFVFSLRPRRILCALEELGWPVTEE